MPDATLVGPALLRDWPLPALGADKEDRGRLVVVAGSRDTPGAGLLSVEGAFRAGAGKVCLATVESAAAVLATAVPELMVEAIANRAILAIHRSIPAPCPGPAAATAESGG